LRQQSFPSRTRRKQKTIRNRRKKRKIRRKKPSEETEEENVNLTMRDMPFAQEDVPPGQAIEKVKYTLKSKRAWFS